MTASATLTPRCSTNASLTEEPWWVCMFDAETQAMTRRYLTALVRSPAEVDDLAQEVFLRACERAERVSAADDWGPFLRGIARKVAQEHYRHAQRNSQFLHVTADAVAADDAAVWQRVDAHDRHEQLRCAISQLPLVSRRMLEMRYHDGLNATQIASRLNISPGAVRATLMRVRDRLRRRLGDG